MEKFNTMLNKLGLRGSSEDDLRRSAQSTPRQSRRHHITEPGREGQRSYGSVSSVENYRIRLNQDWTRDLELAAVAAADKKVSRRRKSRSCDVDRGCRAGGGVGLDRAWELERARGLELLYQSMERQRSKQPPAQPQAAAPRSRNKKRKKDRDKKAGRSRSASRDKNEVFMVDPAAFHTEELMVDPNFRISQERLERRIEELNKQLLAEKHSSRRDKLMLARLQQEMARQKSERQLRETLMRELERERMLRLTAEQQVHAITQEHQLGQTNLAAVQEEYSRMEEIVKSMMMYKGKVDSMKQEKTSLAISYENNTQKLRTHISNLEQENKLLTVEMKNIEAQCANCHLCNTDAPYRISSTVGIPLLTSPSPDDSHKTKVLLERLKQLEAEKSALVLETETQQQQYDRCLDEIANQVVAALMSQKALREECSKLQRRVQDLETNNRQLHTMFKKKFKFSSDSVLQVTLLNGRVAHSVAPSSGDGSHSFSKFSELSLDSLQSICSDYNEQLMPDESLGKAALSSPPPWLRDVQSGDSPTSSILSPASMGESSNGSDSTKHTVKLDKSSASEPAAKSKADPSIPKLVKVPNEPSVKSLSSGVKIETEFPAEKASPKVKHFSVNGTGQPVIAEQSFVNKRDDILQALNALTDKMQGLNENLACPEGFRDPRQEAQELEEMLCAHNQLFDDSDSDASSSCQPQLKDSSAASTVSLNELLDRGLDDFEGHSDDGFSVDHFHRTDDSQLDSDELKKMILAGQAVLKSESITSMSDQAPDKPINSQLNNLRSPTEPKVLEHFVRPNCLDLPTRKKSSRGEPLGYSSDDESSGSDSGLDKKERSYHKSGRDENHLKQNKKPSRNKTQNSSIPPSGKSSNTQDSNQHLQVPSVVLNSKLDSGDYVILTIPKLSSASDSVSSMTEISASNSKQRQSNKTSTPGCSKFVVSSPESAIQSLSSFSSESDTISGDQGFEEKSDTSISGATTDNSTSPYRFLQTVPSPGNNCRLASGQGRTPSVSSPEATTPAGGRFTKACVVPGQYPQNPSNHAGDYVYLDPQSPFVKSNSQNDFTAKYILPKHETQRTSAKAAQKSVSRSNSVPSLKLSSDQMKRCLSEGCIVTSRPIDKKDVKPKSVKPCKSSRERVKSAPSSVSKPKKLSKAASRESHQCVVGYVLIDPPVPKLDYFIPRM